MAGGSRVLVLEIRYSIRFEMLAGWWAGLG